MESSDAERLVDDSGMQRRFVKEQMSDSEMIYALSFCGFCSLAYAAMLGWVAATIMQFKGRSKVAGFALGFSLGIVGIIIAALLPKRTPGDALSSTQSTQAYPTGQSSQVDSAPAFLNRLFGQRPRPNRDALLELLRAFVRPRTMTELRDIVEQHHELLTDDALVFLELMAEAEKNDEVRQMIESRLVILNRCREIGVEAALEERAFEVLMTFAKAETPEQMQRVIRENPGLLAPETDTVLEHLAGEADKRGDQIASIVFVEHRAILRRCRELGVETVFSNMTDGVSVADLTRRLHETLWAFIGAQSIEQRLKILGEHPELLTNATDALFERLLSAPGLNKDVYPFLVRDRVFLQHCREIGIEGAFAKEFDGDTPVVSHQLRALLDELDDLEMRDMPRRIQLCQKALGLVDRKLDPSLWADLQTDLGNSFAQCPIGDKAENTERAIESFGRALQVRTQETAPIAWASTTSNLANAYRDCTLGNPGENYAKALLLYREALEILDRQTAPFEWANTITNMAHALVKQTQGDQEENIRQAIEYYEQARQVLTPRTHPHEWAIITNGEAIAYQERIRGNRAENTRQAINLYEQALRVLTRQVWPYDWAATLNNLGDAYAACAGLIPGDRAESIEQAIKYYEQALEVRTRQDTPYLWAETRMNLGNAYRVRVYGDRIQNLKLAQACYEDARQEMTAESSPTDWATVTFNLASVYRDLLAESPVENWEQSVNLNKQALQVLTRQSKPIEWAKVMSNLGSVYRERGWGRDAGKYLELAIDAYQQALQVLTRQTMPIEWALTTMELATAYEQADTRENHERAITAYNQALEILKPDSFPRACRRAAYQLGNLYLRSEPKRWLEAAEAYRIALQAAENAYQSSLLPTGKEAELVLTSALYTNAGYALARAEQWQEALVTLELGRARSLNAALERDRTDLKELKSKGQEGLAAYNLYQQAATQLQSLEIKARAEGLPECQLSHQDLREQTVRARADLEEAVKHIRNLGYADFMTQRDIGDVVDAVQPDQPLVYLVATDVGGLALVLYRSHQDVQMKLEPLWLDRFYKFSQVRVPLNHWLDCYANWKEGQQGAFQKWCQVTLEITHQLWDVVMEPLVVALQQIGAKQAVLIPTGLLALLPLHAAWHFEQDGSRHYALDEIAFAYAPSASVLKHVREQSTRVFGESLFAIGNPTPTRYPQLKCAADEVAAVVKYFPPEHRESKCGNDASYPNVQEALPHYEVYHFACHGTHSEHDPLDSALCLAGDVPFTARDLLKLKIDARLAFLSACDTGRFGKELPDEAIGLPTAFIQAGTAGVISTLWRVTERSTKLLADRFYENWKRRRMAPLQSLVEAQQWLRDDEADEDEWNWAAFTLTGT
jgi:CHAT domain-containing protein